MSADIIATLKAERKRQGLTLQQLGERLGRKNFSSVWQWETGRNVPSLNNVQAWAAALGMKFILVPGEVAE